MARRKRATASVPALELIVERMEELVQLLHAEIERAGGQVPEPRHRGGAVRLTEREREVLRHMQFRRTDREIASRLGLAVGTISRHGSRIYRKLGVGSREEAVDRYRDILGDDEPDPDADLQRLSDRERQVLEAMSRGLSPAEIAQHLGISARTVERHAGGIYRKLDVSSRGEAVDRYRSRRG